MEKGARILKIVSGFTLVGVGVPMLALPVPSLPIVLLGLAGLVMMIQSRTRTIGLGMAVVAMVAGIAVGIVTKHVNDNTGSSIQLE